MMYIDAVTLETSTFITIIIFQALIRAWQQD